MLHRRGFSHPHQSWLLTGVHLQLLAWENFSGSQQPGWGMVWRAGACALILWASSLFCSWNCSEILLDSLAASQSCSLSSVWQSPSHFAHRSCRAKRSGWCWFSHYLTLKRPLTPSKGNVCAPLSSEAATLHSNSHPAFISGRTQVMARSFLLLQKMYKKIELQLGAR